MTIAAGTARSASVRAGRNKMGAGRSVDRWRSHGERASTRELNLSTRFATARTGQLHEPPSFRNRESGSTRKVGASALIGRAHEPHLGSSAVGGQRVPQHPAIARPVLARHKGVVDKPTVASGYSDQHGGRGAVRVGSAVDQEVLEVGTVVGRGVRCRSPEDRGVRNEWPTPPGEKGDYPVKFSKRRKRGGHTREATERSTPGRPVPSRDRHTGTRASPDGHRLGPLFIGRSPAR